MFLVRNTGKQAIPIRCDRSYGRKKCVTKAQGGHKNKCYSLWIREEFLEEGDTQASTWGNNENSPVRRIEMERTLLWMNRKWAEVGGLYLTVRVVAASNSRLFSVTQVRYQRWGSMEWYQGMKRGKLLEALQLLEARFCNRAGLKGHKEKSEEMMESTRRTLFASLIGRCWYKFGFCSSLTVITIQELTLIYRRRTALPCLFHRYLWRSRQQRLGNDRALPESPLSVEVSSSGRRYCSLPQMHRDFILQYPTVSFTDRFPHGRVRLFNQPIEQGR